MLHTTSIADLRAWLAKARREARCMACGDALDAVRPTRRYCSDACRQEAYRFRRIRLRRQGSTGRS
jgi:predicted nucleic acid-binding Zn ribbon protein